MKKRFAIIGCQHGHINTFINEMLTLGYECVGIYETENDTLLQHLTKRYGVPRILDPRIIWNDKSVQVIGSSAINNKKIEIIEQCEKYGKHIMVDKPIVCTREDLTRLNNIIQREQIQIGMLLTERFRPSIYTLKKILDKGELGEIIHITMRKPHKLTSEKRPKWHFSKAENGGIIIDLFVHDFDLLRWLTGQEIFSINGIISKSILPSYPDFYDVASLQVIMEGQVTVQMYADWHNPEKSWTWGDCRIFITGTKGVVELRLEGDPLTGSTEELLLTVSHVKEIERVELRKPNSTITQDFINQISGEEGLITHKDIFEASRATIEADERATALNKFSINT